MKTCKACCKEIEDQVSQCPYCRTVQNRQNTPSIIFCLIWIFLMIFLMFFREIFIYRENYYHYEDSKRAITTQLISKTEFEREIRLVYEIKNNTKLTWSEIHYRVIGKQTDGKIVRVENGSSSFEVEPHSSSPFSVSVIPYPFPLVSSWVFEITDIKVEPF